MTKSVEQQVSELVDGELDARDMDAVMSALRKDGKLSRQWERSFLVREALRQGLPKRIDTDIANRIRKSIESEPSYLLPSQQRQIQSTFDTRASVDSGLFKRKAVAGLAAAASVFLVVGSVVMKMDVIQMASETDENLAIPQTSTAVARLAMQPSLSPTVTVVSSQPPAPVVAQTVSTDSNGAVWDHLPSQQRQNMTLEEYLVDHSAFSESNTVRGLLPYARVVGYPAQGGTTP